MSLRLPSRTVSTLRTTSLVADERGTTSAEYVLLVCLLAIVAFAIWARLGTTVRARLSGVEGMVASLETAPGDDTSSAARAGAATESGATGGSLFASAPGTSRGTSGAAGSTAGMGSRGSAAGGGAPGVAAAGGAAAGSPGVASEFLAGAIAGDYGEGSSWARTTGQIAVGLVPVVGQIADVRDLSAAVGSYRNGDQGAGVGVAMAAVGFVPGLGDGIKALFRGRRAASETVAPARRASDGEAWEGAFSRVTRDGDEVVKEIKDAIGPQASPELLSLADRTLMANVSTDVSNALRRDEELAQIIVETRVTGPGQMRQRYVGGETLAEVRARDPRLATALDHEIEELVEHASDRLEEVIMSRPDPARGWIIGVDPNRANFRVVDDQLVWFDPIYMLPPAPRD